MTAMAMGGRSPRVLVVQHEAGTGAGWFGEWLEQAGVELVVRHPYAGDGLDPVTAYDGALVLGGSMAPDDDVQCPWLPAVRRLMVEAVDSAVPLLGICLGAQLLALACGGDVRRGVNGPELGVLDLELAPAAGEDPLFARLPSPAPVVQWHWEEISALPAGATLLASTARYANQVFRLGDRAWGVQGHPEVTAAISGQWAREDSPLLEAAGWAPDDLVAEVRRHEPALAATWRPVAEAFAGVVHQHPGHSRRATFGHDTRGESQPKVARRDVAPGN
jgi:GMP synthase (glutamine-hydrolysing)